MSKKANQSSSLHLAPQPVLKIEKSERTRTEIINSALDFIWLNPFRDMTVNVLMAPTSAGRSAFYRYFKDLHEVMETLLDILQEEIFEVADPWFSRTGDPISLLYETLAGLVRVGYQRGPIYRAFSDAAVSDMRFEEAWGQFLGGFDNAVCSRIEADQSQGLIPSFDARPVAIALNRLDASMLISAFGQHPRSEPEPIQDTLIRFWVSALYGSEWIGKKSSSLTRS